MLSGKALPLQASTIPALARYLTGDAAVIDQKLSELAADDPGFTILLSHRPELFDTYVDHDMDLALSGHAHGGQFRRVFDRILEVCVPIMFDGDSFRKSTAADNLKTTAQLLG